MNARLVLVVSFLGTALAAWTCLGEPSDGSAQNAPASAEKTDAAASAPVAQAATEGQAKRTDAAAAEGEAKSEAAPPPVDPAVKAAAQAEFDKIVTEWKSIVSELAGLQLRYRTANDDTQIEIQQQWVQLIAKGEQMEGPLFAAAQKAFAVAPNEDKNLTEFLMKSLAEKIRKDDYESAAQIGKLLMDHHCDSERLPALAGIAAFMIADFDTAEKCFRIAIEKKTPLSTDRESINGLLKAFVANPEYFKQGWAKEKQIRENEEIADNLPRVLLKTSKGDIVVELFENDAPFAVANFIYLVEKKFYNGLAFHRVLSGFMAQGGCPKGDGSGGPGYAIPCESFKPSFRRHFRGSLSMAKAGNGGSDGKGRDTGGSQFFLTFTPTANLDGLHTVFGRVISGMDVLARLQRRDPDDKDAAATTRPDKIIEAKVPRKRAHDYLPKKVE